MGVYFFLQTFVESLSQKLCHACTQTMQSYRPMQVSTLRSCSALTCQGLKSDRAVVE